MILAVLFRSAGTVSSEEVDLPCVQTNLLTKAPGEVLDLPLTRRPDTAADQPAVPPGRHRRL